MKINSREASCDLGLRELMGTGDICLARHQGPEQLFKAKTRSIPRGIKQASQEQSQSELMETASNVQYAYLATPYAIAMWPSVRIVGSAGCEQSSSTSIAAAAGTILR